ncbi:aldo-keto oxidoreductase [Nitzschia inconspicua]|uniref:Aldo-keto oxidoreductase n=1 Tax=Nitzschia inconspicua TaxID=303405 RepID=A0A9K3KXU5_9STRA|nr:aldo-keto oxidoreductase [Nitzschia inconspicua]
MRYSVVLFCLLATISPRYSKTEGLFSRIAKLAAGNKKNSSDGATTDKNGESSSLAGIPTATLSNGEKMPLVGLGVGNMIPDVIPAIVSHGMKADRNIRLIDTSNVSSNEELVAQGIVDGTKQLLEKGEITTTNKVEMHVVTKVWYTHLGYNRTMIAAKSSLDSLKEAIDHPNVDLKVHLMLHWPRCFGDVSWMNCEEEEANLPEEVKRAGPPPHTDPMNAWKESWKALEVLFKDDSNPVASIGVSNFHLNDLIELEELATIQPHVIESNAWSFLYDPMLIEHCHKKGIHMVAYHIMDSIIHKADGAPFAYHHLFLIANDLSKVMKSRGLLGEKEELTPAQVVLAWLVQHSISVAPRTTDLYHLRENSATAIAKIPIMNDRQVQTVAHSVEALISGEDVTEDAFVKLTFHARTKDVFLYWHDPEYGGEIQVAKIAKGEVFEESSHPGHIFRVYDSEEKENMEVVTVDGKYGENKHIEL